MDSPSIRSCTICYNRYDRHTHQPTTFGCGHTFCIDCAKKSDKCPFCKYNSKKKSNLKPTFEMMNMMDDNKKMKLEWIDMMKKQSADFWKYVGREEEKISELSTHAEMRYEKMEREMKDQKEMIEKCYSEYMDKWKKSFDMLVQSKKDEYKTLSDIKESIKEMSSTNSILKSL